MAEKYTDNDETHRLEDFEEDDDEELQDWDDWKAEAEEGSEEAFLCLFCDSSYGSSDALFDHCTSNHHFDFRLVRESLGLDFYGCFKLINYVRSQVAQNICWSCGLTCQSNKDLQRHLHETESLKYIQSRWDSDVYLKPFMQDDSLLYSFGDDDEAQDDYTTAAEKEELMDDLRKFEEINIGSDIHGEQFAVNCNSSGWSTSKDFAAASNDHLNIGSSSGKSTVNEMSSSKHSGSFDRVTNDKQLRTYIPKVVAKDIKIVNEDYFGSYSSFGIHREMLSDKVRMDAYGKAILKNPSLLKSAVVMDVGCGTGILSFFAARAGASRVISVEASEKMAAVATQLAKDNGLLRSKGPTDGTSPCTEVVEIVQSMVEELDKRIDIQPHSVDVLISEWMGYCLLYESMLGSVLFARDQWLKPGGAILPDTATIFVAGFGKGGTSLPFWENVYGFNMSSVGKELVEDAARIPIVDVVDDHDLVTSAAVLQTFDLVTMTPDEMDFTATVELEPKFCSVAGNSNDLVSKTTQCYGVVLWFDTGFTTRFCKEMPANLSTSPATPKTHWSQTILTFREPIVIASEKFSRDRSTAIGTDAYPATRIHLRISIVRASQHRSIDISLETAGVGPDGRKRSWPVQLFNLR
ncbi:probable protein arginine N-methyltransferase 3 [Ziziphus jujuba]|uniref:Probable protein arginine N-methyltransferase 3 n=1 Tax=Ziziphus jujuba TaxID=326968 RepID=A0A6P4ADH0_ZIZJJ|nr:probable protein arginine N-methyltransferase 3 [Ziziphus jujuba]